MGQSNLPIYAYIDETGNTGHNIFDEKQPDFYTAALISRGSFDIYRDRLALIAEKIGAPSLHARELGVHKLEIIAPELLKILIASKSKFFISKVQKSYLLIAKIFDTIFDSGENAAVAWHHYNLRPTRLMLTFKLAGFISEDAAKLFWNCIMTKQEEDARRALVDVCVMMLEDLQRLNDIRASEIFRQGLEWARDHSESIQIGVDRKIALQGHFPNMVAFGNLLAGLDSLSKSAGRSVAKITHDTQSEFQKTLKIWHEMFSTASGDEIEWAGEKYSFQRVVGSHFEIASDALSPGIQIADVILWLYVRVQKRQLPEGCASLVQYALANGWHNDFSFEGVDKSVTARYGEMLKKPLTPAVEFAAREELAKLEIVRQESMKRYEADGLPPFMRSARILDENDGKGISN